jgi:K+-sensing histidine kinase KdpD
VRVTLKNIAGTAVCAATALSLTLFLRDGTTIRLAAPVICIQVIIITALFSGRLSALIGAILAGVTFALLLYPPYGHLWIHDPAERITLTLFELAALCVVRLSPPDHPRATPRKNRSLWEFLSFGLLAKRRRSRADEKNDELSTVR